jgi:hypothetical protein
LSLQLGKGCRLPGENRRWSSSKKIWLGSRFSSGGLLPRRARSDTTGSGRSW